jgi:hypothetical protein
MITHDALLEVTRSLHCAGSLFWFEGASTSDSFVVLDLSFIVRAFRVISNINCDNNGMITLDLLNSLMVANRDTTTSSSSTSTSSVVLQTILLLERYKCIWRVTTSTNQEQRWFVGEFLQHLPLHDEKWPQLDGGGTLFGAQWRQIWQLKLFDAPTDFATRLILAAMHSCVDLHVDALWRDGIQFIGAFDGVDATDRYHFFARLVFDNALTDTIVVDACCVRLAPGTQQRVAPGAHRPPEMCWLLMSALDRLLSSLGDDIDARITRLIVCNCLRCRGAKRFNVDDIWNVENQNDAATTSSSSRSLLCNNIPVSLSKVSV